MSHHARLFRSILLGLLLLGTASLASAQGAPHGTVIDMWENLNVRAQPDSDSAIVAELAGGTSVPVQARTRDNVWFQIQLADGQSGWVSAGYITLDGEIWQIPVFGEEVPPQEAAPTEETPSTSETPLTQTSGARVSSAAYGGLNLRDNINGSRIALLPAGTPLTVLGAQSGWLNVQTQDGQTGWVSAAYVALGDDTIPTESPDTSSSGQADVSPGAPLPQGVAAIYQRGQAIGNVTTNFSRIGDSISASEYFLYPFGHGAYDLGTYGHLQSAIDFFSQGSNSFLSQPIAAYPGWTTADVLNPALADSERCNPGETPLACEYRTSRPTVALIMFGSNDLSRLSLDQYAANLDQIVQLTISNGTIPVLTTIPPRNGYNVGGINSVVQSTAARYGVPVWDYHAAMVSLPDSGLSADGLHPSVPEGGFGYAANFTEGYLKYGYVQRNLGALTILYTLWHDVLAG
ncbi:SH3 domain-containing protein [Phototrophicus methaneseepsis]|uniref:SH3 domain-containing protein n=1 Tax=Phototrophicus methaneseepsis TaxID=2710758 RepID=A0A7S8ECP1_9CHLR|nr:SH3 domain-containing protein [Phototrophicus methaneseepsis]QPC84504.1 SH3 domain-containing protein [Phototrophicus methaneseepsis]